MAPADPPCDRFEREGLLRLERGEPLDPHFDTCPACRQARADYQRMVRENRALDAEIEPPPGWQARVWGEIGRRQEARKRSRNRLLLWAPAAAAAGLLVALALRLVPLAPAEGLRVVVEPGESVRRGVEAQPGDRLLLEAQVGEAARAELRIYRNDRELVLRCSTREPCRRRGDVLEAHLVLPSVGTYQPLLLVSDAPIPAPTSGGLDADAEAALETGARVELGDAVRVR